MIINLRFNGSVKRLTAKLAKLQPFMRNVGEYMVNRTIKECFDKEQSPDGQKWQPLSPARVKQRMKKHKTGSMKILQDTGELRRSVRYEATNQRVAIGSKLVYAATHQFGRGNIPARPFLAVTEADRQHILRMLATYLNGGRNVSTSL